MRELANRPDGAAVAERELSRARFWTWVAVASLPICLAACYWLLLKSKEGDYLLDPRGVEPRFFVVDVWPIPKTSGLWRSTAGAHFLIDHRGRWLLFGGGGSGIEWWRFDRLPGEGGREFNLSIDGYFVGAAAEKFPRGSVETILSRIASRDFPGVAAEAKSLEERFPDRLTPKYWRIAALCASGRREEGVDLWAKWRGEFERSSSWRGAWYAAMIEEDLEAAKPENIALRASFVAGWPPSVPMRLGLGRLMEWMEGLPPVHAPANFSLEAGVLPDFLSPQVVSQIAHVEAHFLLVAGDRERALGLLFGAISLARTTGGGRNGPLIPRMIRVAIESIAIQGLESIFVHSTIAPEAIEREWPRLVRTLAEAPRSPEAELIRLVYAPYPTHPLPPNGGNHDEVVVRHRVLYAKFDLLLEATRARHRQARRGAWPEIGATGAIEGDLLPLPRPILDAFAPGQPMRAARTATGFAIWSVGPDGADDGGSPLYDPTNGSHSVGDIAIRLDEKPRYDFPSAPGHVYRDLAEWRARYPFGLPRDLFSNAGQEPLRLSEDGTFRLWSFGPDADQGSMPFPDPKRHLHSHYDPTNGTTSWGDLWMNVPFAAPANR
jgi:hypothetical protein